MPKQFRIKIQPVAQEHQNDVSDIFRELIERQIELLLNNGGTVAEHIREEFANQIEERLENEGVTVILERMNGQFRIKIEAVNSDRKEAVSEYLRQVITEFIGWIVSEGGTVIEYVGKGEADEVKGMLEEAGATVIIEQIEETEESKTFIVKGQVTDEEGQSLSGMRVRAFDRDISSRQLLGETETNQEGHYEISYTAEQFLSVEEEKGGADLVVRALNQQGETLATSPVRNNADEVATINLTASSQEQLTPDQDAFVVKGEVRQPDGHPFTDGTVKAFDKDLRHEQQLGTTSLSDQGRYEITYTPDQFRRAEKQRADLIVRVFDSEETLQVESSVIFNAQPVEVVNLAIAGEFRELSEYEQLQVQLEPALDGASPRELSEEDIEFLINETQLEPEHIRFFVQAAKIDIDLDSAIFYGFARQGLPTDLLSLLARGQQEWREALEAAIAANIISLRFQDRLDYIIDYLKNLAVEERLKEPTEEAQTSSLGSLLNTTPLNKDKQRTFVRTYLDQQETEEDFWQKLRENPEFQEEGLIEDLQFTLQVGALTQNYPPLVQKLKQRQRQGEMESLKDLAKLDTQNWQEIINQDVDGQKVGVPTNIPGENEEEKAQNYAESLTRVVESAFPTAFIAERLKREDIPNRDDFAQFFDNNPNFDFGSTNIEQYFQENEETAIAPISEPEPLKQQLKQHQRIFKLAPRYSAIRTLLDNNLDSAQSIMRLGSDNFVKKYAPQLGEAQAKTIYAKSRHNYAKALTVTSNYRSQYNQVSLNVLSTQSYRDIPEWETLFGSLDLCECKHCRSVYSPAAYLVDLLNFLSQRDADKDDYSSRSVKDVLFWVRNSIGEEIESMRSLVERRADIGKIELTCENTNTPVPYIDLVNEILENAIAPADDFSPQTNGTAAERRAIPQHLNKEAYNSVANEIYPWNLPFDLWVEEARVYLDHLGGSRHELIATFSPANSDSAADPPSETEIATASEFFGLTPVERKIITGQPLDPERNESEFWGLENTDNWTSELQPVSRLLQRSGLSYVELLELINTKFVNPEGTLQIDSTDPDDPTTCNLDKLNLSDLDSGAATRIQRLVRLWRKLDWSIAKLDEAIAAMDAVLDDPNDALSDRFLWQLLHIQQLQQNLDVPLMEMLSWWSTINTDSNREDDKSLYEQVFQNETVTEITSDEKDPFKLNYQGYELENSSSKVSENTPALLAALEISAEELSLLTTGNTAIIPNDTLNLANLSRLYRTVSLARALDLNLAEFLTLKMLTGIQALSEVNSSDKTKPENTLRFIEKVRKIRNSNFTITELNYLLRHEDREQVSAEIARTDKSIGLVLSDIREELQKIATETTLGSNLPQDPDSISSEALATLDPTGEQTRKKLEETPDLGNTSIEDAIANRSGSHPFKWSLNTLPSNITFPSSVNNKISHNPSASELEFEGAMTEEEKNTLLDLSENADYQTAIRKLFQQKFGYVLAKVVAEQRQTQSESLVKQKLSEELNLDTAILKPLVTQWVNSPNNQSAMAELLTLATVETNDKFPPIPRTTEFEAYFQTFILLEKIAAVIAKFQIKQPELKWLIEHSSEPGWLALSQLPTSTNNSPAAFAEWERLVNVFRLRDGFSEAETTVFDLFSLARDRQKTKADFLQKLSKLTGWSLPNLRVLVGAEDNTGDTGLLNFTFPDDFQDDKPLLRINACFQLLARLGMSADKIGDWIQPDVSPEAAQSIKQAVKAKYNRERWLQVAESLQDTLREKQRSALVSFLVANPILGQYWEDANDLYAYFLIDIEMSACQMSSRIKQAISSVQLFVQRCLMNLEDEVDASVEVDQAWRQWEWRKNYRVWEANRKVFLYPENWIEPELRQDKSPFFEDLESELLQDEVTQNTAETAFLNYLEKLDTVARLEIVGMYHQKEEDAGIDILHVFGRTYATPHLYYYRRWVDSSYWTPWERVDLDIQGDHILPVVWNRRLYLFWAIFTEKPEEADIPAENADQEEKKPIKFWEIQLTWSEYKEGKWSPKQLSKKIVSQDKVDVREKYQYAFIARHIQDELIIRWGNWYGSNGVNFSIADGIVFAGCDGQHRTSPPSPPFILGGGLPRENARFPLFNPAFKGTIQSNMMRLKKEEEDGGLYLPAFFNYLPRPDPEKDYANDKSILEKTPQFGVLYPAHDQLSLEWTSLFYQDNKNTFFITPEVTGFSYYYGRAFKPWQGYSLKYQFQVFYHPYTCMFIKELNQGGIDQLLQRKIQVEPEKFSEPPALDFQKKYDPVESKVIKSKVTKYDPATEQITEEKTYPQEMVDFSYGGAYSQYNWELFFHAPLLIADRLSQNQRFEEAQKWFHYIFNPTDTSDAPEPQRYWQMGHFFKTTDEEYQNAQIRNLLRSSASGENDPELDKQIQQWQKHPFQPHAIARLRTVAYQKSVVMKYLDNLIAWGDQLFRRDTIETINEATQLYILAAEILGPRPERIPPRVEPQVQTYNDLEPKLGNFSNALVEIENYISVDNWQLVTEIAPLQLGISPIISPVFSDGDNGTNTIDTDNEVEFVSPVSSDEELPTPETLYFCIPKNDKLLEYWDTVADRLFKIRHCLNIEGVKRQLPLFEPPIEPGMLVKATAAGVDLSSALNDISAAVPHYRFQVMVQKAIGLCSDVKALGGAMLSALEKQDAEELSLLRSSHEVKVLETVRQVKEQQIEEVKEALEGLQKSKEVTQARKQYYESRDYKNANEGDYLDKRKNARDFQIAGQSMDIFSSLMYSVPEIEGGISGAFSSPVATAQFGGNHLGNVAKAAGNSLKLVAYIHNFEGETASIKGGYDRRKDDWDFQADQATKQIKQIDQEIEAANIRLAIAEKDLENHELQIENAKEIDTYMSEKFTNKELYSWMVSQISSIYFQSYQLAYDIAKRAEKAYQYELSITDSNFIQFGYWDSLKKGLLSGEKLHYDIKRMEMAYLDQHKREYELTKHVSLAMLDPMALLKLKETGECFVSIPEILFDIDYPGHYMRRIKSVSITIPCVTGPYTSVSCTLTLVKNSVRATSTLNNTYGRQNNDPRFQDNVAAIQSIATSSAQNDGGMFELNFNDERYLPFEGAGAISEWRIELPNEFRQFDYNTITDVIIHMNYTAREGGNILKEAATENVRTLIENATEDTLLMRMFSAKHDFPGEWHQFLHSEQEDTLEINLNKNRFPFQFKDKTITIRQIDLYLKLKEEENTSSFAVKVISPNGDTVTGEAHTFNPSAIGLPQVVIELSQQPHEVGDSSKWKIVAQEGDLEMVSDMFIVCRYTVTTS
jgi:hypothetical protein